MARRSTYSAVVRLLLVEDDVVIARELLLRWGSRGWMAQARTTLLAAEEALAGKAGNPPYDLIVLDGLAARDRGSRESPVPTRDRHRATSAYMVASASAGPASAAQRRDDYLVKPFDPDELDARIEAVQRRGQVSAASACSTGGSPGLATRGLPSSMATPCS
jgi:DNA-binding response OmpR family regulator